MNMQLQKLIKILIVILGITFFIILMLGLWFYFKGYTGMPVDTSIEEPVEENTPTTPNPNQNQPATPATPTPTPEAVIDAETLYAELLLSIGAKKVEFPRVNSGDIYALYAADVATAKNLFPEETDLSIGIATIDLTGDKVAEAIVYVDLPGYCGSGGCGIDVWKKEGGVWVNVFEGLGYDVATTESSTNGYNNLIISMHGSSAGYMTEVSQFVFKGPTYDIWNVIAVWNGSRFVPTQ